MNPLLLGGILGGAGLLKNVLFDRPREEEQNLMNAEMTRYSPWTGMKGKVTREEDALGDAISSGTQGLVLGSALDRYDAEKKLLDRSENLGGGSRINQMPYGQTAWYDLTKGTL